MTVGREHLAGLELARQRLATEINDERLLDELIDQASAAPEQKPVAWKVTGVNPKHRHPHIAIEFTAELAEGQAAHWRSRGRTTELAPLHTHADPSKVARPGDDLDTMRRKNNEYCDDLTQIRQELAERDALLRRVIDTGELSRVQHSELEADICEVLRPAECETCNDHGLIGDLPMECPDCEPAECCCPKIGEPWNPKKHGADCPVHAQPAEVKP